MVYEINTKTQHHHIQILLKVYNWYSTESVAWKEVHLPGIQLNVFCMERSTCSKYSTECVAWKEVHLPDIQLKVLHRKRYTFQVFN